MAQYAVRNDIECLFIIISDKSSSLFAVKNWSLALDPTSGLPPDVAFNIIIGDLDDECSGKDTIAAHKYFLAMVSPVFKAMFFGLTKETREVVPIRGTSKDAFTDDPLHLSEEDLLDGEKCLLVVEGGQPG